MRAKLAALAVFGLLAPLSIAQSRVSGPNGKDARFVPSIAFGNAFESRAGKLAQSHGTKAALRRYGARLVRDHDAAQARLARLAPAKGLALPSGLTPADRKLIAKLDGLRGGAFDRTFKRAILTHHHHAAMGIEEEIRQGRDPQILGYARRMRTVVRGHIRALEAVQV